MVNIQYLAGFLDGEGSIMISATGRPRPDGVQASYSVKLVVCNTNVPALTEIQKTFGGRLVSNGKPQKDSWKPGYFLLWQGQAAGDLIEAMRPYLLIKQEQADVALEFLRLQRTCYRRQKSDSDIAVSEVLAGKVKTLNARGPAVVS